MSILLYMAKERLSIFKSVLRSFLKALFVVFGLGIGFAIGLFIVGLIAFQRASGALKEAVGEEEMSFG